ncbi:MAG: hypothetical protein ABH873_00005 [Candidatus Firestonebacteria bacterium]
MKILLFLLVLATTVMAGQWVISTVPVTSYSWEYSMVIDSDGVPVIGYSYSGVGCVKYISGYGWLLMQDIDSSGSADSYNNSRWLSAGKNGSLHAAYEHYNGSNDYDLKYAKWNGNAWSTELVPSASHLPWLYNISIVVDTNDNPHIIYYDGTDSKYKYVKKTSTSWGSPAIIPNYYSYNCLAIDGNNTLHTAYHSWDSLYHLTKDGNNEASAWTIEEISTPAESWGGASIAVGPAGMVAIAYRTSSTTEDLKCAIKSGGSWQIHNVDVSDEKVGNYISVAIDNISNVHIAYNNYSFDDLKYAKFSGGTWNIQTVDSVGKVGYYCSIATNSQNNPCIAYEDDTNNKIKYAYWMGVSPPTPDNSPANVKIRNNSFKPEKGEKMEAECELFQPNSLKINIYNLKNDLIKTVIDEYKTEGKYNLFWEGKNSADEIVGSGLYIVIIEVGSTRIVKKAVVIK